MSRLDAECCGNFSCFYFDVDLENKNVSISEKTPKNYIDQIRDDFEIEINGLRTSIFSAASWAFSFCNYLLYQKMTFIVIRKSIELAE